MTFHIVSDHVARKAGLTEILLGDIIRKLRLVEPNSTTFSTPLSHVTKCVLHKETIHCHIIANDLQTWLIWVKQSMVRAPEPKVVTNNVTRMHSDHFVHTHFSVYVGAANTSKDITHDARASSITRIQCAL